MRVGFPLQRLMLEITETSLMRDPEATRSVLVELQKLGIRIAIDDFGTGYSSLAAFQHYRADAIKIDAGFTSRIDSADGGKLAMALLNIARIPGADVIAEGSKPRRSAIFCAPMAASSARVICSPGRWKAVCSAPMP